jgi:hypothetical protein
MKATRILSFFLCWVAVHAHAQAIEIRGGHSLVPGDYVALSYHQPTNFSFGFGGRVFLDKSKTHGLNYSAIGVDGLVEFPFSAIKISGGPTVQYESEPWVYQYRSFSQKLNYGLCVDGSAALYLTEAFSLTAFANQKFLFNKNLGQTHFVFGIGIKYSFSNF